jgi:hypothetical protein
MDEDNRKVPGLVEKQVIGIFVVVLIIGKLAGEKYLIEVIRNASWKIMHPGVSVGVCVAPPFINPRGVQFVPVDGKIAQVCGFCPYDVLFRINPHVLKRSPRMVSLTEGVNLQKLFSNDALAFEIIFIVLDFYGDRRVKSDSSRANKVDFAHA